MLSEHVAKIKNCSTKSCLSEERVDNACVIKCRLDFDFVGYLIINTVVKNSKFN